MLHAKNARAQPTQPTHAAGCVNVSFADLVPVMKGSGSIHEVSMQALCGHYGDVQNGNVLRNTFGHFRAVVG
jgi:hypothetical protein